MTTTRRDTDQNQNVFSGILLFAVPFDIVFIRGYNQEKLEHFCARESARHTYDGHRHRDFQKIQHDEKQFQRRANGNEII